MESRLDLNAPPTAVGGIGTQRSEDKAQSSKHKAQCSKLKAESTKLKVQSSFLSNHCHQPASLALRAFFLAIGKEEICAAHGAQGRGMNALAEDTRLGQSVTIRLQ